MARLGIGHPDFVYRPITDEHRQKLCEAHRRRLNIPAGHVRIYGVFVPEYHSEPLRSYAAFVAMHHGFARAKKFVEAAGARSWAAEKPFHIMRPGHTKLLGVQVPNEHLAIILPYVRQMSKRKLYGLSKAKEWLRNTEAGNWHLSMPPLGRANSGTDWSLVDALLEEGMNRSDIAEFLGVRLPYLRMKLNHRKRAGQGSFGSGPRIWKESYDSLPQR